MKCPKKSKDCDTRFLVEGGKKQFICAGVNSKPKKWKKDKLKLCLKGYYVDDFGLEMTNTEALFIVKALVHVLDIDKMKD